MSQQEVSISKAGGPMGPTRHTRYDFFGGLFMGGLLGALLAVTVGAFAQFGGPRFAHSRSLEPEVIMERAEFVVDFALRRIDATDAQREQIKAAVQATIEDLQSTLAGHGSAHDELREILTQPYVDRVALEQLRTSGLQHADVVSQRMIQTLADTADILTQEQRVELMALGERFRH